MGGPFARLMEKMNAASYEAVLDAVRPAPGQAVLEIGFGTGDFLLRAAKRMDAGHLAGVDPAPLMVRMARRKLGALNAAFTTDLREADASRLDWPDKTFDAVVAIHSFQFWPDPAPALSDVQRILKPCGLLCLCLRQHGPHPPDWLPNPLSKSQDETSQTLRLLDATGFLNARHLANESRAVLLLARAHDAA